MFIKLPRKCLGREVVAAFKAASRFDESEERKWEPEELVGEFQFEPGSVRQAARSVRVVVSPSALVDLAWAKNFLRKLIGLKPLPKLSWVNQHNPIFTLKPVLLKGAYDEVKVDINYQYGHDDYEAFTAHGPENPAFEKIRPQFEQIIGNFFAHLQD